MEIQLSLHGENSIVAVQDDGWKFNVDLSKARCTCGQFNCRHLKLAYDVTNHNAYEHRYLLLSAFHKEIRRSDLQRAFNHAALLGRAFGKNFVSNYVQKIVFEETRNPNILKHLNGDWRVDTAVLGSSVKKWEIPGRSGHVIKKARAYLKAVETRDFNKDPAHIWKLDNYYDALAEFLRVKMMDKSKEHRKLMIRALGDVQPDNPIYELSLDKKKKKISFYEGMMALEFYFDLSSPKDWAYHNLPTPSEKQAIIEYPADWTHDNHTSLGLSALKRAWKLIKPSKRLPAGLDLRWTGSILGCLWREQAVHQFGVENYRQVPWEKVKISEEDWDLAKAFDCMFYRKLYSEVDPGYLVQ